MKTEDIIKKIPELKLEVKPKKPIIAQYYNAGTGWFAYDLLKGKELSSRSNANLYVEAGKKANNRIEGIYYEYIPEIESITCMLCSLDIRKPLKNIPRKWHIDDVFFITSHKELITNFEGEWLVVTENISTYLPFSLHKYNVDNYKYYGYYEEHEDNIQEAFSHLFPIAHLKASKTAVIDRPTIILEFLDHKEQKKRSGPKQTMIDELTAIKLPDVVLPKHGKTERTARTGYTNAESFVQISKVKENVCCLRYFVRHTDSKVTYENVRIYVDGKTFIGCKKNNQNEYVQFKLSAGKDNFSSGVILPFEKSDLDGTTLQYFGSIFDDLPKDKQSLFVWMFLQYPLMEKLYKAGFKELVLQSVNSWYANPTETLTNIFGTVNAKEKNIHKCLGINKHQFNKYLEFTEKKKQDVVNQTH